VSSVNRATWLAAGRLAGTLALTATLAAACASSSGGNSGSSSSSAPAGGGGPSSSSSGSGPVATVETHSGAMGTFLTDAAGRSLYLFDADKGRTSACSGNCATYWPPLLTGGAPKASGSAVTAKLGTTTRSDGTKQVTYNGHPLYTYAADTAAGATSGQGSDNFGAKWWLVAPSGQAITSSSAGSSSASSSSAGGGGGGWS
jgi:predicted lipoprotein with Yx(FWY)xxD motif